MTAAVVSMHGATSTDSNRATTTQLRRSLLLLRRSVSLSTYGEDHADILELKGSAVDDDVFLPQDCKRPKLGRHLSVEDSRRLLRQRSVADGSLASTAARPLDNLSPEMDVGPLASSLFEGYFDTYIRCILLPVALIFLTIYTFFQLPVQPRAEIYRSLSATFILLVGIVAQCSVLTFWASRRYGLAEFIVFLRYCLQASTSSPGEES